MTTKVVADEVLGHLARKQHDLFRRVREGVLDATGVLSALQNIIEGRFGQHFQTWKTVKLGTGLKTANDFCCALQNAGCRASNWAKDVLGKPAFTAASNKIELDLVVVSVAELGFKNGATREQIYQRAPELGLELCPAEVGPQLRLQYKNQLVGERLLVAMEPIIDSVGDLRVFVVARNEDDSWLRCHYGPPSDFWFADFRWVFSLRK